MSFSRKDWQQGHSADGWQYFGCHSEKDETVFRVWAPGAQAVAVTGKFCDWSLEGQIAAEIAPGIFECRIPGISEYEPYKFLITSDDGTSFFKSDPFAFHAETPPKNASKLYFPPQYHWNDKKWMAKRNTASQPINIYQIHAGSFRTYAGGEPLNYRKLGEEAGTYLKRLGCTHLGLMTLLEHMEDVSEPMKTTGFFALTSRYGTPLDFCRMVEHLHQQEIGVVMDMDLLGFPTDDFGLSAFIGKPLWEAETSTSGRYFAFESPPVRSFLLSCADYWLETYHLDGLRLMYTKKICARPGGKDFLLLLLQHIREKFPGVLCIGDEEALPFHLIMDNDASRAIAACVSETPCTRSLPKHGRIRQVDLPLVGQTSLINQMPGSYDEEFARLRAAAAFYYALPGAKLILMGNEFAQFTVWSPSHQLDWMLLDYEMHRKFLSMTLRCTDFYRKTAAIWKDSDKEGRFELIEFADHPAVHGFIRRDESGSEIIVLANFSDKPVSTLTLGVSRRGKYAEIFSSDEAQYGGEGRKCNVSFTKLRPADGQPYSIEPELAPFTTVYFYKSPGTAKS